MAESTIHSIMSSARSAAVDTLLTSMVCCCRFFYASSACIYPEHKQLDTKVEGGGLKESDAWPAQVRIRRIQSAVTWELLHNVWASPPVSSCFASPVASPGFVLIPCFLNLFCATVCNMLLTLCLLS